MLVPVILVLLGLVLLSIPWLKDGEAFYLTTDAYPGPQNIVMNQQNYETSLNQFTPEQLAQGLPDYDDGYWVINYYEDTAPSYKEFYDYVNETQVPQPYRYGSYQIYKADTSDYDF